jgi:hypothetical protein
MMNPRWLKIIYFHMFGDPESKQLKVAALKLFHPTASPLSQKGVFLHCDTVSRGRGNKKIPLSPCGRGIG